MRQLALVQFFTWLGLFCMWLFFVPAVARNVFGARRRRSPRSTREGVEWGGFRFAIYSVVCFAFAFAAAAAGGGARPQDGARIGALLCGAAGLLSVCGHPRPVPAAALDGAASASRGRASSRCRTRSWPGALPPERMGVYMGIFNFFIVIPEILRRSASGRSSAQPSARTTRTPALRRADRWGVPRAGRAARLAGGRRVRDGEHG